MSVKMYPLRYQDNMVLFSRTQSSLFNLFIIFALNVFLYFSRKRRQTKPLRSISPSTNPQMPQHQNDKGQQQQRMISQRLRDPLQDPAGQLQGTAATTDTCNLSSGCPFIFRHSKLINLCSSNCLPISHYLNYYNIHNISRTNRPLSGFRRPT